MQKPFKNKQLSDLLGSRINDVCNQFALSKLKKNDFIRILDAYSRDKVPNDIVIVKKDKHLCTVKNSKHDAYRQAYTKKLIKVLNKIK